MGEVVLLVEDNPDDVLLTRRAFAKAEILTPLRVLGDGQGAIDYLSGAGEFADRERNPLPVVVLLDLKLPRRSGFEVLQWLRAQPGLRRMPVVVLTSSEQSADINHAFDLGANSYLVKPVRFEELLEIVRSLNLYWLLLNRKPDLRPPEPP